MLPSLIPKDPKESAFRVIDALGRTFFLDTSGQPGSRPAISSRWAALPDAVTAGFFLWCWIDPLALEGLARSMYFALISLVKFAGLRG